MWRSFHLLSILVALLVLNRCATAQPITMYVEDESVADSSEEAENVQHEEQQQQQDGEEQQPVEEVQSLPLPPPFEEQQQPKPVDQQQQNETTATDEVGDNRTVLRNGSADAHQKQRQNRTTTVARRNFFGWLNMDSADGGGVNAASCYDSRLTNYINNGLHYYSHNMGQLSKYIMDQIKRAGYTGFWFVHATMIGGQTQGLQWQSQSNGDIFAATSRHGCYYHDTQTYIVIIRY